MRLAEHQLRLKSITREAADCRAAWAAVPDATAGVHIHHEVVAEALTEPIWTRITYSLTEKPQAEQALRLRLMRPVAVPAQVEYDKIMVAAQTVYDRIIIPAQVEYNRIEILAWTQYITVVTQVWAKSRRGVAPAQTEYYDQIATTALAKYRRDTTPAQTEFAQVAATAQAEYDQVAARTHRTIYPTSDCPWNGRSIFAASFDHTPCL